MSVEEKGRSVPRSSQILNLSAMIVLCLVLLVMVNYLAGRHYVRGDWTSGGFYHLSDKTLSVLGALDQDVEVVVFISEAMPLYLDLKDILYRYGSHTKRLSVEFVDPDTDPVRFRVLQKKYKVRSGMLDEFTEVSEQVVVVRAGENSKFLDESDMTDVDFGDDFMYEEPKFKGFKAEEAITGAILEVTTTEKLTVCFVEGHGEWDSAGWDEDGIGTAVEFLRRDNYEIDAFDLGEKSAVSDGCAAAVVAGPQRPLPRDDAAKLETYLRKGGALLLFLEPVIDGEDILPTGLEDLLEKAGIGSTNTLAVETDTSRLLVGGGVGIFITKDYAQHAIVGPVKGIPSFWSLARPLTVIEGSEVSASALVRTSESSWGERHIGESDTEGGVEKDSDDIEGPLVIGAASRLPGSMLVDDAGEGSGRIVVYGDVHLLASGIVDDPTWTNRELFVGAVAWLTERESLIAIPPKEPESFDANLTTRDLIVVAVWVLVTIPGLVLLGGVLVWFRRRR